MVANIVVFSISALTLKDKWKIHIVPCKQQVTYLFLLSSTYWHSSTDQSTPNSHSTSSVFLRTLLIGCHPCFVVCVCVRVCVSVCVCSYAFKQLSCGRVRAVLVNKPQQLALTRGCFLARRQQFKTSTEITRNLEGASVSHNAALYCWRYGIFTYLKPMFGPFPREVWQQMMFPLTLFSV